MLKVAIGHSNDPDSDTAIAEILEECHVQLSGDRPKAGILFAAPDFEHDLILNKINQRFPGIQLIGCTSDGEISSVLDFQQDSLSLILFCSDDVEFYATVGRNLSKNPCSIAKETGILAKSNIKSEPQLCIAVPESLTVSGVEILNGLKQGLGSQIPIIGGTAGDQWQFQATYQFFGNEVLQDSLPILLLSGNLHWGYGASSGWTPIGTKGMVTKVHGNVLYEVDGQPALNFFQNYLGNMRPSPEYRLAVFESGGENWYMRISNGSYDGEMGSITFFADIPEAAEVQVVSANRDEIVSSAQTSAKIALENYTGEHPAVALFFSCTGRMRVLGTRTKEEFQVVKQILPPDIPCCGFYTYGEITPLQPKSESQFHNETFVTLVLGVE
ncbi:FIST signal transduction protein [Calothrix sp. 336/3]|uniref:FIST signal transduction protein n=1 Tax=Calothrix sp. 336/3 TaxID=1337936 RepID=UPI0004E2A6AD|nr:FIST N-terminal domain-containing protein [Calothrix sp. 336/3]AKG20891.1 hypothetical protein IJ00_05860 [Calothrix sp. 336/3]